MRHFKDINKETDTSEITETYYISEDGTEELVSTTTINYISEDRNLSSYVSAIRTTCFISTENKNHIKISSQPIYRFT